MRSDEVLRRAAEGIGVKALAGKLRLSPALVYKWCQESNIDDNGASGARNPLDRLSDIVRATGSIDVVSWLCHDADGFFVSNPKARRLDLNTELLINTQRLVQTFSQLLLAVTQSIEDDGQIEPDEADRIRSKWERLKSTVEAFTVACERGEYLHDPPPR